MNAIVGQEEFKTPGAWSQEGRSPRVAVIGSGFSGVAAIIKLREAGYTDIVCYERQDRLGGTWRDNRYPGLSCDVPSHWYSYSFALNPDWSHRFSYGPEIAAYLDDVAEKYDVKRDIRFNTGVSDLTYLGPQWRLTTDKGEEEIFDLVIAATGVLVNPSTPDIKGLDSFAGEKWHTARWRDDVSLKGKRVAIIGTGSTSCQIVGAVAQDVAHLSVFQRTPHWVLGIPQIKYSAAWKFLLKYVPGLQYSVRLSQRFQTEQFMGKATLGYRFQQRLVEWICRRQLRAAVPDQALRERLTPSYKATCKRLIISSTYYPALTRDNVDLVTEGIDEITPKGVRTVDGTLHECDILLLATGFHTTDFILPTKVTGEDGRDLGASWEGAPRAHRALTFPGFPNFFMLHGPTGVFGNTSLIDLAEYQIGYMIACMDKMRDDKIALIAPKQEAYDAYNAAMAKDIGTTTWATGGCDSWYLDASGTPNLYPWLPSRYRREMRKPEFGEFRMEREVAQTVAAS
ncbi:MAG: NAD(P)/FAD-dependent oxidoreductase [Pseudomonadota bacterium]